MITRLENLIFHNRRLVLGFFVLMTAFMAWQASHLRIDAGFAKLLPLEHPYMKTYMKYRDEFGGANRVVIAIQREGRRHLHAASSSRCCSEVTDDVFFLPGVDRTRVMSLFTPNVRFTEVVEDGISGGNIIPDDFEPTPGGLRDGALERPQVAIRRPARRERLLRGDRRRRAARGRPEHRREARLHRRRRTSSRGSARSTATTTVGVDFDYHIIGFAKVIGDIAAGAARVVLFFLIAFLITAIFVYVYSQSIKLTLIVARLLADRGRLAARAADAARLRHRPDVDPGAVPRLRDRGQPRRADGERVRRRRSTRAPTA